METEIWKDILGYEGKYQVSNQGRVRNLKRKCRMVYERQRTVRERILKAEVKTDGYCRVTLSLPTKRRREYVHRLVCEAFLPNPENKPCVNHKDGNRENNSLSNLEWCTVMENTKDRLERRNQKFDQCEKNEKKN